MIPAMPPKPAKVAGDESLGNGLTTDQSKPAHTTTLMPRSSRSTSYAAPASHVIRNVPRKTPTALAAIAGQSTGSIRTGRRR